MSRPITRHSDALFAPIVRSVAMRRLDEILHTVAGKDVVLTLLGESGTGKELLARRAHELSDRCAGPFVPINCAAIPEAVFESELFGHERGAFTGATELARGKVEAAEGGTLFLDEIGEMPLVMQAKLLRFLEHRRFMRVGGRAELEADVRLVCATLRPIEDEVAAGRFRADLFYRIQGITLRVPPLRERPDDVRPLVDQFLLQASTRHGVEAPRLSRSIRSALLSYPWPGNVRELRTAVEMLCLLRAGEKVRVDDLPDAVRAFLASEGGPDAAPPKEEITLSLNEPLEAMTDRIVEAVLALEGGNRTRAARRLGVSVRTIQRRLEP